MDAILGPSSTPNSLALLDPAGDAGVPFVSLAGSSSVIDPPEGNRRWAFKLIPSERVATVQIVDHMLAHGWQDAGAYRLRQRARGRLHRRALAQAKERGSRAWPTRATTRPTRSVTPQVLRGDRGQAGRGLHRRELHAGDDARSSSSGRAAIPGRSTPSRASPGRTRCGWAARRWTGSCSRPCRCWSPSRCQRPTRSASRRSPMCGRTRANTDPAAVPCSARRCGTVSCSSRRARDRALQSAQPGTPAFRTALRDAMERVQALPGCEAIFTLTPQDHSGAQANSQVMVEIRDGAYRVLQ